METTIGPLMLSIAAAPAALTLSLESVSADLTHEEGEALIAALGEYLGRATATIGIDEYEVFDRWEDMRASGQAKGTLTLEQARNILRETTNGVYLDFSSALYKI